MILFRTKVGPVVFQRKLGAAGLFFIMLVMLVLFVIIPCAIGSTLR